ncbi:uncharacterized protein [Mycetomoellerius zeteki]|uniref:uncharacterized protein n=1 Tax=Mycetomoellerius zeteki TaxID=64791 RepID=UPI00084E7607|nr:PREDICTED: uncharacterized protein LOC108726230 [Trachymyrmex zeteki]
MHFLRDLQLQSKTISNIDSDCNDLMDMASSICDNSNSSSSSIDHVSRKRRFSEDSALDRIADSLSISFNMDQIKQMLPPAQAAFDKPTIIGNMIAAQLHYVNLKQYPDWLIGLSSRLMRGLQWAVIVADEAVRRRSKLVFRYYRV